MQVAGFYALYNLDKFSMLGLAEGVLGRGILLTISRHS
jgi:hypothetical protein